MCLEANINDSHYRLFKQCLNKKVNNIMVNNIMVISGPMQISNGLMHDPMPMSGFNPPMQWSNGSMQWSMQWSNDPMQ